MNWRCSRLHDHRRHTIPLNDHIEATVVTVIALLDDLVSIFEPLFSERVGKFGSLLSFHQFEDFYFFQEIVIFFSLKLNSFLYDVVEGLPVKGPELALFGLANDGGCSGRVVKQSQFSERFTLSIVLQELVLRIIWAHPSSASELSRLDQIKVISIIILLNNHFARLLGHQQYGVHDGLFVLGVET